MSLRVLSEVSAMVAEEHEAELVAMYRELVAGPMPDGLIRTELLRGVGGRWRVQSLWQDVAALDAVRADHKHPGTPELFRKLGAEPDFAVYEVAVAQLHAPELL